MKVKRPSFVPKDEVNFTAFMHRGLMCFIFRPQVELNMWHLCGYVVIPEDHPLYTLSMDSVDLLGRFNVHGGVSFCDNFYSSSSHIACRAIGFDCNHGLDLSSEDFVFPYAKYRDIQYVIEETKSLAEQIASWGDERD